GAGRGAVDGRVPRRLDQDRRPRHGRGLRRARPRLLRRRSRHVAAAGRRRSESRLRGDRQARGRPNPRQDGDKRASAGL
ncbi:MAG: 2,3,4,5-tetrahydropyridine-2,6-dicarboxylate N-succinyltransferase, partial [uncultured Sphingomonadaceae bacterium]